MTDAEPVRDRIIAALRDTERFYGQGQLLIGGVGLVVIVGGFARGIPWLSAIGLVFFGGLFVLMVHAQRRTRTQPIRQILLDEPQRVTAIEYYRTSSSSGAFPSHWLRFRVDAEQVALRFDKGVIDALAPFLARYFVNATISIPNFDASASC